MSEQRDDEVTELTQRLSVVEEEKEKLRKEKEKVERKLKEAEMVAEQASAAATEVYLYRATVHTLILIVISGWPNGGK